jgi:hypothetical protein
MRMTRLRQVTWMTVIVWTVVIVVMAIIRVRISG